jgi:glycosyltransferase involved in cell wall biosynthesis
LSRPLFLTESFSPVVGGGEIHIRELSTRLARDGLACSVVTRRGRASWPATEQLDGVRVLRVLPPGFGRAGKYLMAPFAAAALARERRRFDVVVVRGTRILGPVGLLAGRALGKAVVLQAEVNGELSGEIYTWGTRLAGTRADALVRRVARLRNLVLRRADAFVAMSALIRDEFIAAGVAPEKVAQIPHGVDTVRFFPATDAARRELRQRLGIPRDALVVVNSGRMLKGKGLDVLLDAFELMARASPMALLVLVGSGAGQALSVEEQIRARAAALDGRVLLTGQVSNVEDYLRAGDVFAFPSLFEALGISLVEAAACGLACVGSRTGGIVDVIDDGRDGLLVRPGDVQELADALGTLARDAGRRQAFGRAARQKACAKFGIEACVSRYRELLEQVHRRASRGSASGCAASGSGERA